MKINAKYFNEINTTPKEVQNTKYGNVEIHSLNDYKKLYDVNIAKGNFYFWSNKGKKDYKLLIEDSYYEKMNELYTFDINEIWLSFYEDIDIARKSMMLKVFLPTAIVVLVGMLLLAYVPFPENVTTALTWTILIGVFIFSIKMNKTIQSKIRESKNKAVDKIKQSMTEKRFNEVLDIQDEFIKEFHKARYIEMYGEESYNLEQNNASEEENLLESADSSNLDENNE